MFRAGKHACTELKHRSRSIRTTMTMALHSSGVENTIEMNIPLESKYWYFENNLF